MDGENKNDSECDLQFYELQAEEFIIPANMSGIFAILKKSKLLNIELWNSFIGKIKLGY